MNDNIHITVTCPDCVMDFDEKTVESVDIAEDFMGKDRLTFVCPKCGKTVESIRRG